VTYADIVKSLRERADALNVAVHELEACHPSLRRGRALFLASYAHGAADGASKAAQSLLETLKEASK